MRTLVIGRCLNGSMTAFLQFLSFVPSDAVDMPFKITVADQLCQNKLLEGRDGAGIKSELILKRLYKATG